MKKYIVIGLTLCLVAVSIWLMGEVVVNYDMTKYLPDDHVQTQGIELHDELYGKTGYTYLLIEDGALNEALAIKSELLLIDGVSQIDFMDTVLNEQSWALFLAGLDAGTQNYLQDQINTMMLGGLTFTESFYTLINSLFNPELQSLKDELDRYQNESFYKMVVAMSGENLSYEDIIENIREVADEHDVNYTIVGGVMSELFARKALEDEVLKITLILIPLVLVILMLMSSSFADLIIFIVISGVAIVINLGTNAFFSDISFVTQSMAIALQLAISLDYIIFIVHRYHKNRDVSDSDASMKLTMKQVGAPVIASATTTGASFIALVFMRFSIGTDIGLVFLKAIILSCVASLILGPLLLKWLDPLLNKTKHRVLIPNFTRISHMIYKLRYVFLVVFLLLIVPSYYFQAQNKFIYGETSLLGNEGTPYEEDMNLMIEHFGYDNQLVIITTKDRVKEQTLYDHLTADETLALTSIQSAVYYQRVISDPVTLAAIEQNFYRDNYQRMMISLDMEEESESSFETIQALTTYIEELGFDEIYVIGTTSAALSIKDVIQTDYVYVTLIAIVLIILVILITFKNWLIPLILTLVIMTSVFLAMSIPYFLGYKLAFLGYLIVSTILLGATIDYAILFTKRYIELRDIHARQESIEQAIKDSAPAITTSALILAIAGLSIGLISSILAIQQIGLLIAFGAIFGFFAVLILLPQLIYIFDRLIIKAKITLNR